MGHFETTAVVLDACDTGKGRSDGPTWCVGDASPSCKGGASTDATMFPGHADVIEFDRHKISDVTTGRNDIRAPLGLGRG